MKKRLPSITLIATILLFHSHIFGQQTVNKSFVHDGITRTYSVYIPASYSASNPVPLVLNLHGLGSNGAQQALYTNFQAIADTANFILVHPNGTVNQLTGQTFWNIGIFGVTVDDVGFLSNLVDTISANYSILQDRIYSTGMSNGGYMSYALACQTNKFRAIGSVTGGMTTYMYSNCTGGNAIPIIQIHGTEDQTVPYDGNSTSKSIEDVVALWVNKNNCNSTPIVTQIPNTNTSDGATAEQFLYTNGTNNHTVELFKVTGGGHTWPGAMHLPGMGNTCQDFSATKEIWRFFSQYNSNQPVSIEQLETENFDIYPNPTTGIVHINHKEAIEQISLFDNAGRFLRTLTPTGNSTVDMSALKAGIYFMEITSKLNKKTIRITLQ